MNRPLYALTLLLVPLPGCGPHDPAAHAAGDGAAPVITDRIDVPSAVVENLGITFAAATRGKLERWLRVPGELVAASDRTHQIAAPADGRVVLIAKRWQSVQAGDLVARLEAPALNSAQASVARALAAQLEAQAQLERVRAQRPARIALAAATITAAATARDSLQSLRALWRSSRDLDGRCEARLLSIRELASSSSVAAKQLHDAERERHEAQEKVLAAVQAVSAGEVALRQAELDAAAAGVDAAGIDALLKAASHRTDASALEVRSALTVLSALTGLPVDALRATSDGPDPWRSMPSLELRAPSAGVVETVAVAAGRSVAAGDALCTVIDSSELRFRGQCPEDDLERIPGSARVRIAVALAGREPIESTLLWPPRIADPIARTVLLEALVPNAVAPLPRGLTATASILIGRSDMDEVLIPAAAVTRDGLETLVFRRNPENHAQVIRTPVTLGARTKDWVEVIAGVSASDQVVVSGVQQLKQTGAGKGKAGGHFHADGTFHEGADH